MEQYVTWLGAGSKQRLQEVPLTKSEKEVVNLVAGIILEKLKVGSHCVMG